MREELIFTYVELIQSKIAQTLQMINDLSEGAQNDAKSSAGDKHETSLAMMHLEQEKLNRKLEEYYQQIQILNRMKHLLPSLNIKEGSLIETTSYYFVIGVALPQIKFKNKITFGLSLQAPLAQILKGKKCGDTFFLKQNTEYILRVE